MAIAVEVCHLQLVRTYLRINQCLYPTRVGRGAGHSQHVKFPRHVRRIRAQDIRFSVVVEISGFHRFAQPCNRMKFPVACNESIRRTFNPALCGEDIHVAVAVNIIGIHGASAVF